MNGNYKHSIWNYENLKKSFGRFRTLLASLGKFRKISDKIRKIWGNFHSKTKNSEKFISDSTWNFRKVREFIGKIWKIWKSFSIISIKKFKFRKFEKVLQTMNIQENFFRKFRKFGNFTCKLEWKVGKTVGGSGGEVVRR